MKSWTIGKTHTTITRTAAAVTVLAGLAVLTGIFSQANAAPAGRLVALGDSVAAGAGLPQASNASLEDKACGRSPQAYPALVAARENLSLTNLTCSGAGVADGLRGTQTFTNSGTRYTLPAQIDRAFEGGVPSVITLTIGANDLSYSLGGRTLSWQDVLQKCYTDDCGGIIQSTGIGLKLTELQARLGLAIRDIKTRSGSQTPPRVYITEYYYPISSTTCLGSGLTLQEATWINYQAYNLNKAIRQVVTTAYKAPKILGGPYNFVTYVPVNFNGHGICSATPWIQGLGDPAPVHPTATGQTVYANALTAAMR